LQPFCRGLTHNSIYQHARSAGLLLNIASELRLRFFRGRLAYRRALEGIRATQRGQQPKQPDAFLLRDAAIVLMDCGLRPEECFRLKWMENIRDGAIEIHTGKGRGSRRRIPISPRVRSILEMRRTGGTSEWVFPAPTKSGHIESSSLKKQHAEAVKTSGVVPFVLYTFRHTCITRWAKHMDPFTLHVLAGHTDMNTTKRYVHPSDEDIIEAMERVRGGHKYGHTLKIADPGEVAEITGKLLNEGEISGATRRDRTGDLLITNRGKWHYHRCALLPRTARKACLERVWRIRALLRLTYRISPF